MTTTAEPATARDDWKASDREFEAFLNALNPDEVLLEQMAALSEAEQIQARAIDWFNVDVRVKVPQPFYVRARQAAKMHDTSVEAVLSAVLVDALRRGARRTLDGPEPAPVEAPPSRYRWFTEDDVAELKRLHAEGLTDHAIAKTLDRSVIVIRRHREKLGLAPNRRPRKGAAS